MSCAVSELESVVVDNGTIRVFSLTLSDGVSVEVCSLGASIIKFLVPSIQRDGYDDVVLGYASPRDMWSTKNPLYLGTVVGRVANRIAKGEFQATTGGPVHKLETNNGPNHLHGGSGGFHSCIWEAEIVNEEAVRFSLLSSHGDQGYPGSLRVTATYSLCSIDQSISARLCLYMEAILLDGIPTPVNLAQHSYFNLARHDDPIGILDHRLQLPNATAYTPLDDTSIPTRQVRPVPTDKAMDWRESRLLRVALAEYGVAHLGLSPTVAEADTQRTRIRPDIATAPTPDKPYGFDHNYVIERQDENNSSLTVVAILEHADSGRRLTVSSNAPGVQLYTANYLDGTVPTSAKDGAHYGQWQGICLETQHFPDSILVNPKVSPEFAQGACQILTAQEPCYRHCVEYLLETQKEDNDATEFRGIDSEGRHYSTAPEMWLTQGVTADQTGSWYRRAAAFYEDNCPPTIDGVLGGFGSLSDLDLATSRQFLHQLLALRPSLQLSAGVACECGAGIGRVTKGLLLNDADLGIRRCDLVESSSRLLYAAPDYLGDALASKCRFFCTGLQDWEPKAQYYSIVWIQWVLIYLTDDDAVAFLRRCGDALVPGGVIVLKENTCTDEDFVLDVDDASVTRATPYWKHLCRKAGLDVVYEEMQGEMPDDMFPVSMIALSPTRSRT